MTTKPTEEGNDSQTDDDLKPGTEAPVEEFVVEDDPMLLEAKAAEAEIAAKAAGTQPGAETPKDGTETPAGATEQPKDDKAQGSKGILVPKARLDEVLSERDLLRDQNAYLKGLNDARTAAPPKTDQQPPAPGQPTQGEKKPGEPVVDEIEAAIAVAEEKKLALAEKYDNGEISSKQWKTEELVIDKEIRGLSNKRMDKVREESRNDAQSVVTASQTKEWINGQALTLQAKHPNVAVIDALKPGVAKGVWDQITEDAKQVLASNGTPYQEGNPQSKAMLMAEKARLTDNLEGYLPGFKSQAAAQPPPKNAGDQPPGQPAPSEKAQNLKAKIELANSQPPPIADMGTGAGSAEITESDIEGMTDDQVADLLQKAPQLVQRIVGSSQNRG